MTKHENAFQALTLKELNEYASEGWDHATIRKVGDSDYISFETNRIATGSFWDIKFDNGFRAQFPASIGKDRAIEYARNHTFAIVCSCEFTTVK